MTLLAYCTGGFASVSTMTSIFDPQVPTYNLCGVNLCFVFSCLKREKNVGLERTEFLFSAAR